MKHHKNAAPPKAVSKIIFVHEDMLFCDVLTKIIVTIKCKDLFHEMHIANGEIFNTSFHLNYTITRMAIKNIELQSMEDFTTMMAEAQSKPHPAIMLAMVEKKVLTGLTICPHLTVP